MADALGAQSGRRHCKVGPLLHSKTAQQCTNVNFDRVWRQIELSRDFLVGMALQQQSEHPILPRRQTAPVSTQCRYSKLRLAGRRLDYVWRYVDRPVEDFSNGALDFRLAGPFENITGYACSQVAEDVTGSCGTRQHSQDKVGTIDAKRSKADRSIKFVCIDIEDRSDEFAAIKLRSCIGKTKRLRDRCVRYNIPDDARDAFPENTVPRDEDLASFDIQHGITFPSS